MTEARDIPDAIDWHDGMLLAPQHFQQQALRHERQLTYHVRQARPFHWGVVHLQVDRVQLVSGLVQVRELEAILPDGLVVDYRAGIDEPLEVDISAYADPVGQTQITIHLIVPAARGDRAPGPGETPRYASVEGAPVADQHGGEELSIARLRPRLALFATTGPTQKPPQKFVSMPIAQATFRNDAFVLTDFVPPAMTVAANAPLGRLGAEVVRRVREKALFLAERSGVGNGNPATELAEAARAEIRSLVTGLPPLEAQLGVGVCHPFDVYMSLCTLAGHLSAFASGAVPAKLSRYDHDDPMASFGEVRDFILRMIDRVKEGVARIPFTFEDGMFGLPMDEAWLKGRLVVGVRGPASAPVSEVAAWMENCIVASRSRLETLSGLRVKGAERVALDDSGEGGVAAPRGVVPFEIKVDPRYIVPGERLEIWNPDSLGSRFRPVEITLFVSA
ncbi:type VI secretion system baseplate subunit TssK [Azospirillum brasilense]|uniref:type VI secretion system baseplate subunit TssK n=1 Tax=Azospirillum brasilense TaxID=192 RepID=UPI000E691727|nr:type VI secretion system baseplate subunit TssK [Azospirillum brasilense]NUB27426.1 type VI secretion system baseplate subunit TssK [Azospirillum brasilense]NUB33436.1 type VI secretion system baseplate subunit TssK [Azospirillum brasilense]RIV99817.1 type VI secretion system baseplate subunit TssK [Azospirillum brasilense]